MPVDDMCEGCFGEGKCPRCGADLADHILDAWNENEDAVCDDCGLNLNKPQTVAPQASEYEPEFESEVPEGWMR